MWQFSDSSLADMERLLTQAVFNAMVLSEAVYKATDHGISEAAVIASQLAAAVPLPLSSLSSIQWSLPHVRHQYMIGESATCVFVCAIGTKFRSACSVLVMLVCIRVQWPGLGTVLTRGHAEQERFADQRKCSSAAFVRGR